MDYNHKYAMVKREVRKMHLLSCDKYVSDIENDVHGTQYNTHKISKHLGHRKFAAHSTV